MKSIPLSLYIHIPWCVRKCPYCDFNSHQAGKSLPEAEYLEALVSDLEKDLSQVQQRSLHSIFIGGGTPSLFSAKAFDYLLNEINKKIPFEKKIEITLEANPGTAEQDKFSSFRKAGINRLSMGIQSFQDEKLKALGRIHGAEEAKQAVSIAKLAGFDNFNLDLMHGLPNQTSEDALYDLKTAIDFQPPHLSWYQLTLEPNTVFAKHPPRLPQDEKLWAIQEAGEALLEKNDYQHYEISAYSQAGQRAKHNINYWEFGDYLGIGAGAHGKTTNLLTGEIQRSTKKRNPRDYLLAFQNHTTFLDQSSFVDKNELAIEFMMNALRLIDGVNIELFAQRTGLSLTYIQDSLNLAQEKGLLESSKDKLKTTALGQRFLNECLECFMN